MYCSKCEKEVLYNDKFCGYCGAKLDSKVTNGFTKGLTNSKEDIYCIPFSFEVYRTNSLGLRKEKWTIRLSEDFAELSNQESNELVRIPKEKCNSSILIENPSFFDHGVTILGEDKNYRFELSKDNLSDLRSWLPKKCISDMKEELRKWGIGLIVIGFAHLVFNGILDPVWGAIIIILGVFNLLIEKRGMFIANGIALLLVGTMNIFLGESSIFDGEFGGWIVFGFCQLLWGVQEIQKFGQYPKAKRESKK